MTKTTTKTKDPKNTLYPLIAFRLDASMAKQIESASKEMGVSKSKVIKSAIEQYLLKRKK